MDFSELVNKELTKVQAQGWTWLETLGGYILHSEQASDKYLGQAAELTAKKAEGREARGDWWTGDDQRTGEFQLECKFNSYRVGAVFNIEEYAFWGDSHCARAPAKSCIHETKAKLWLMYNQPSEILIAIRPESLREIIRQLRKQGARPERCNTGLKNPSLCWPFTRWFFKELAENGSSAFTERKGRPVGRKGKLSTGGTYRVRDVDMTGLVVNWYEWKRNKRKR